VNHRREIEAKYSKRSLALKIREDDLLSWGIHAWLRNQSHGWTSAPRRTLGPAALPPAPSPEKEAIRDAILAHGRSLAEAAGGADARFTPDDDANRLIFYDAFACTSRSPSSLEVTWRAMCISGEYSYALAWSSVTTWIT
jgi:hypothetical protein